MKRVETGENFDDCVFFGDDHFDGIPNDDEVCYNNNEKPAGNENTNDDLVFDSKGPKKAIVPGTDIEEDLDDDELIFTSKPEPVMIDTDASSTTVPEESIFFGLSDERRNAKPVIGSSVDLSGNDEVIFAAPPGTSQNVIGTVLQGGEEPDFSDLVFDTSKGEVLTEVDS